MNNQMIHVDFKKKTLNAYCSTQDYSCCRFIDCTKHSTVMTESQLVIVIDHLRVKNRMQKVNKQTFLNENLKQVI